MKCLSLSSNHISWVSIIPQQIQDSWLSFSRGKDWEKNISMERQNLNACWTINLNQLSFEFHSHWMSCLRLSPEVVERIDRATRRFLWGNNTNHKEIGLIIWDQACWPKAYGVLGIINLCLINRFLQSGGGDTSGASKTMKTTSEQNLLQKQAL